MSIWITGVIGVAVILIGLVYIGQVRSGGSGMHRAAPLVIALAILGFAINELAVIPTWGQEAGKKLASVFFMCVILPLSAYLSYKKPK